jgi:hypothetical protein
MKTKTTASGATEAVATDSRTRIVQHAQFGVGQIIGEKFLYEGLGWVAQVEFATGVRGTFGINFLTPLPA